MLRLSFIFVFQKSRVYNNLHSETYAMLVD